MRSALALAVLAACGSAAPKQAPPPVVAQQPAEPAKPVESPKPAEPPKPVDPPLPADPRLAADLKAFDMVWQRVADTFWDPKYNGVDWAAVRKELRPKVEATKTRDETRQIMNQALERLGKSHFGVTGPLEDDPDQKKPDSGTAGIGFDVRVINKAVIVTRVEAKSPAEAAKLKVGDEIVKLGDAVLAPKIAAIATQLGSSALVPLVQSRYVMTVVAGAPGTKVTLGVRSGNAKAVKGMTIERAHVGRPVSLGNLGNQHLVFESRLLDKDVLYIRLSIFLDPVTIVPSIAKDLVTNAKAAGVIFDLRGNPGGLVTMAPGIAGYLMTDENKKIGTMKTRQTSIDYVINPQSTHYPGKVAVLVDDLSASTSEVFASGLQELGRARIFGRRTPGAALPSVIEELPNGDRFQYAVGDFVSASGKHLEGVGVTPDVPITLDVKALRSGKDPDIVAATRWIKEKP